MFGRTWWGIALAVAVGCAGRANSPLDAGTDAGTNGPDGGRDAGAADAGALPTPGFFVDGNDPNASDSNPGTATLPWRTLQKAASTLAAGQAVLIKPATYVGDVQVQNSGDAGAWITFEAQPGAVLDGGSFLIQGVSYVQLDGLSVQNTPGDGIHIGGEGQYITVTHNAVSNTVGSCIAAWGSPGATDPGQCLQGPFQCLQHVVIDDNTLNVCNNGGYNECLDIVQGVDQFEVRGNTLRGIGDGSNGGEGIDLKGGNSNGVVAGNTINPISRPTGIYMDGNGFWAQNPTPRTHDIVIAGNRLMGTQIRLDSELPQGQTASDAGAIDHITIENNVVAYSPEDGIVVYQYPGSTAVMDSITVINNTTYGNSTSMPFWNGISLASAVATNILIRNNIAFGNLGNQIQIETAVNDHNLTTDPQFVDVDGGDFHVLPSSPAIDAGSPVGAPALDFDGVTRSTVAPTIGAYER